MANEKVKFTVCSLIAWNIGKTTHPIKDDYIGGVTIERTILE
jgi:hypothetical protein